MILIFGAGGYMGSAITCAMRKRGMPYWVGKVDTSSFNRLNSLRQQIKMTKPKFVINTAAYIPPQSVALCENHKLETVKGNLIFPIDLANACECERVPLVHFSTGCLFQGDNNGTGWTEKDDPQLTWNEDPGIYISTKHAAETHIKENPSNYIIRIRLPFDHINHHRNLLEKMRTFDVVCDWKNSLTNRTEAASQLVELLENNSKPGVYHMTCDQAITSRRIIQMISEWWGLKHKFQFVGIEEFQKMFPTTTKSNCTLSCAKLSKALRRPIPDVVISVAQSLKNWIP